jgi:hypothetical protein
VGQDGKRYGLPKDWDTVAMFYNKKLVKDAGYTEEQLANLDWNPQDGGSYEKAIAHLTVDKSGKRGDEPGFNKKQEQRCRLRPGPGKFRQWPGPDAVELPHRDHRLDAHGQEPVGHQVQLRRPQVPGNHQVVGRPRRQGLHAQA